MRVSRGIQLAAIGALLLGGASLAFAQLGAPTSVYLTPYYASDGVHAGATFRMALGVELNEGFHVQSNAPDDPFLIPTELLLDPPAGIEVEGLAFPEAITLEQAGLQLLVFEERFVIGVELRIAADVPAGPLTIPATLKYQACDAAVCYSPTQREVEFRFDVVPAGRPTPARDQEIFSGMVFDTPRAAPDASGAGAAAGGETGSPSGGAMAPAPPRGDRGGGDRDPAGRGRGDRYRDEPDVLAILDDFEVIGTTGGYVPADDFLAFIDAAEAGETQEGFFAGRGPLAILALTLIGGLALNLTPCVLPMVPINLAIIGAGSSAGSRARGFVLGSAYGLAMALVYGGLGLVVILTAGTFGTINASPWFNLGIAVLFVVLALAMFDKLVIDFSRLQSRLRIGSGGRGSVLVAFAMGGVAALLAGACVAPVVIQVIVFSSNLYATGTTQALALPFVLGLGMALPWPIAGAGIAALPKPGAWMNGVKHAFGVVILVIAGYYGYLSYELFSQYWVDPDAVAGSVEELLEEGWHASLAAGLDEAKAQDKLVLVDMWATWCKNCLAMDKTTLKDPEVRAALSDYVKVKLQSEDLNASPIREIARRFGAIGLPAYAILRPAGVRDAERR